MSAATLLAKLEAVGVHLIRDGGTLRVRGQPGVNPAPYREQIAANKPALLALMRGREELSALGLDPALPWVHVSTEPVAASIPPTAWDGTVPDGCGVPHACRVLGPCPHFTEHSHCWRRNIDHDRA